MISGGGCDTFSSINGPWAALGGEACSLFYDEQFRSPDVDVFAAVGNTEILKKNL